MGFGEKWVGWKKWCISTMSCCCCCCLFFILFLLINGILIGFFRSYWGLSQGGLLSPYLFVIVMEGFYELIERVVVGG